MRVFIDELTWPELEERLRATDIAYLPVGTVECHGPHLPLGTDLYVATAVCVLAARDTGGLVLPPLAYSFTGATSAFKGAVSVPMRLEAEFVKAILKSLWGQGFRRLFVVSIHGPNDAPLTLAVRELYEYDGVAAVYFNPYKVIRRLAGEADPAWLEACLAYASLTVLGKGHLVPDTNKLKRAEPPPIEAPGLEDIWRLGGVVGFRYTHPLQHMPPREGISVERGLELLRGAARALADMAEPLKLYVERATRGGVGACR